MREPNIRSYGESFALNQAVTTAVAIGNQAVNQPMYLDQAQGGTAIRMLSPRDIAAIVNINLATATPLTVTMMNKALLAARSGEAGTTVILCHPIVKFYLDGIGKTQHLVTQYGQNAAGFPLDTWNGVPIITPYNFMNGTEANITVV